MRSCIVCGVFVYGDGWAIYPQAPHHCWCRSATSATATPPTSCATSAEGTNASGCRPHRATGSTRLATPPWPWHRASALHACGGSAWLAMLPLLDEWWHARYASRLYGLGRLIRPLLLRHHVRRRCLQPMGRYVRLGAMGSRGSWRVWEVIKMFFTSSLLRLPSHDTQAKQNSPLPWRAFAITN